MYDYVCVPCYTSGMRYDFSGPAPRDSVSDLFGLPAETPLIHLRHQEFKHNIIMLSEGSAVAKFVSSINSEFVHRVDRYLEDINPAGLRAPCTAAIIDRVRKLSDPPVDTRPEPAPRPLVAPQRMRVGPLAHRMPAGTPYTLLRFCEGAKTLYAAAQKTRSVPSTCMSVAPCTIRPLESASRLLHNAPSAKSSRTSASIRCPSGAYTS